MGDFSSMHMRRRLLSSSLVGVFIAGGLVTSAVAADLPSPTVAPQMPVLASDWASTITHTLQLEAGIAVNPDSPGNHNNFGQEFTDKPNEPQFNQLLVTFTRPVDSAKAYDIGFNFQALFGSDARYDPTIGLLDYTMRGREQFVFTQANVVLRTPGFTAGGIDTKIGLIPGAMGYETTDPSTRPFYTLSYITNYLLAFETVGALSTIHINPTIDIYTGIDAGNEVTPWRDQNSVPAGYIGFGLNNLLDNKLTVLAVSRLGSEASRRAFPGQDVNSFMRYWNDVTVTYKATDKWTFVGEGNYLRDESPGVGTAFGFAGYSSYAFNDEYTLNLRAEIYRDNTGITTTGWISNTAFTSTVVGNLSDQFYNAPPTTYGAITAGITAKPNWLNTIQNVAKITIRPEVRYDASLNGTKPFDVPALNGAGTKSGQFLFSTDVIVAF
jgi:hypothetical protein